MKKVCVVTGGGSGIGFAAAKEAAKKGYYVMIVGRNEKKLAGAVEELRKDGCEAEAYSCDVSDREHCFALARPAAYCRNESAYGRCGENHAGKRTWNRQYQRRIF